MTPLLSIAKLVWCLAPIAADLGRAIHRDSDEGRAVTEDELARIFDRRKVEIVRDVNAKQARERKRRRKPKR